MNNNTLIVCTFICSTTKKDQQTTIAINISHLWRSKKKLITIQFDTSFDTQLVFCYSSLIVIHFNCNPEWVKDKTWDIVDKLNQNSEEQKKS